MAKSFWDLVKESVATVENDARRATGRPVQDSPSSRPSRPTTFKQTSSGNNYSTSQSSRDPKAVLSPEEKRISEGQNFWDSLIYGQSKPQQERWEKDVRDGTGPASVQWDKSTLDQKPDALKELSEKSPTWGTGGGPGGMVGGTREKLAEEKAADEKKTDLDNRGSYASGLGFGKYETEQMSWDEYNALSPRQRAVVDANTALSQAIQNDLANANYQQERDPEYDSRVEALFGSGGGSDTYAPETVALLETLGLKNDRNDLDNYLSLSSLVTADDLAKITPEAANLYDMGGTALDVRLENALSMSSKATAKLSETLAAGQTLLDSVRGTSTYNPMMNPANAELDNRFEVLLRRETFDEATDEDLGMLFDNLKMSYPELTDEHILGYFESKLKGFEYAGASGKTDALLGTKPDQAYISPEEFRNRYYATPGGN